MGIPAFKAFDDIKQIGKIQMNITQKIHGTNAHILIVPFTDNDVLMLNGNFSSLPDSLVTVDDKLFQIFCGSRSRYIFPGDDNFGFAAFVYAHKEEFIRTLGIGRHDGEWAGPGINSGEGLAEKTFVLFDFWKFPSERPLPPQTRVVPVLYQGPFDLGAIETVMKDLLTTGSKLVLGFMRPEGVVIQCMGTRFKKVFSKEETKWDKADENYWKQKAQRESVDYSHLLQPIRLEKLLSRNEVYLREYPKSLPQIVKAYIDDLVKESQIVGSEEEITAIRKGASGQIFAFVRSLVDNDYQQGASW